MKLAFASILIVGLPLLAGCAVQSEGLWGSHVAVTTEAAPEPQQQPQPIDKRAEFEATLSSWTGQDINDLISRNGAPSSTYHMPNGNVLYTYFNSVVIPATIGMGPMELTCTVNYEVDGKTGLILRHSYKGCIY